MKFDGIDELVREYERGASIEGLAARYQIAYGTVRTALLGAGVTLRRPGRPRQAFARVRFKGVLPTYGTSPRAAS